MAKFKGVSVGEFCRVKDHEMGIYGIRKGDIVYIAGSSIIDYPVNDDPYLKREIFVAIKCTNDGHVDLDRYRPFTVDGSRLKALPKKRQEVLTKLFEDDHHKKEVV